MKTILGYLIDKLDNWVLRLDVWYAKKYGERYTLEEYDSVNEKEALNNLKV